VENDFAAAFLEIKPDYRIADNSPQGICGQQMRQGGKWAFVNRASG
jgi:hypothetical protein